MGLGSTALVGLAEARELAADARRLCKAGIDPIEQRKTERAAAELQRAQSLTFKECAARFIASQRDGWSNSKHVSQWENTLATYAEPVFGEIAVQDINTTLVLKVLEPIWPKKTETASRVRGRIEAVLDWATARGYRQSDNPARWRGHLDKLLPRPSKVRKVKHHAALPYKELSAFMFELRAIENTAARALEFLILTAGRTTEVLGAKLDEINARDRVWTIPSGRMKAGAEHRVPLSARALQIIGEVTRPDNSAYLFPGRRSGRPLSNMSLLKLLDRMGRCDLTAHGFRSTFRDWAAEETYYVREVAEMALAHSIGDKVEAAYRRGDLFEKRKCMMDDWTKYCSGVAKRGNVVVLNRGSR